MQVSQWGEAPIFWKDHLIYVDIEGHKIIRTNPETLKEQVWDIGERIGTVVPHLSGGYIYAGDTGINTYDPITGTKTNLADPESHKRGINRFNDGKCDPYGRFWGGTISLTKKIGDAALYMLDSHGQLHRKLTQVTNSNGICWDSDAKKMFYIDTATYSVRVFDFEAKSGDLFNPLIAIDTKALGLSGSPDGMTIDSNGNLWIAFCHGGSVICFDPVMGEQLCKINLPCIETTACAFGGPNLERLFVTTGIHESLEEPYAGRLMVIDGLGVHGVPSFAYSSLI
jgi:sugar lactone lactonase YvrE